MLQCHPYPHEYADPSRQCAHCAFFMGLSRKEGVKIQEGQQFDIRGTVDEFRHEIGMYMFWKPGMELAVSHVRRKQIPAYVFPEGHRRYRPPQLVNNQQHSDKNDNEDGSPDGHPKRKHDCADAAEPSRSAKRASISPVHRKTSSPQSTIDGDDTCNNQIKSASGYVSDGSQASRGSGNLERANGSNSQASERSPDTAASVPRCATRGIIFSGEGTNKHDIPIVEKCTPPAVAVCIKRVAEKVVSELVGSERLGSNNSAELLGGGVAQGGLPEELEVRCTLYFLIVPKFGMHNQTTKLNGFLSSCRYELGCGLEVVVEAWS
jgi:poly(A) polymerase